MNTKKVELKKEIDSLLYRRLMYQYFRMIDWNYITSITSIKVFKQRDGISIEIETHRPGLLIGKAGKIIDELRDFIKEDTKENIHFSIKECMLWYGLYVTK